MIVISITVGWPSGRGVIMGRSRRPVSPRRIRLSGSWLWLAFAVLLFPAAASAQDYTWNAASGNWNDSTKWLPNTGYPVAGDTATINNGGTCTQNSSSAINAAAITVSSGTLAQNNTAITVSGALTISGGTLTCSSSAVNAGSLTVSAGSMTRSSGTTTVSGAFLQSGGTISAGGTLNLDGDARFDGGTFTAGTGTVQFRGTSASAWAAAPAFNIVTVAAGASLTAGNNFTTAGALTVTGTLDVGARTVTSAGTLGGVGTLRIGTGTVNANGTYSVTGTTEFTGAGRLEFGGSVSTFGTFTAGTGTAVYRGSSNQTVRTANYYNLEIATSGGAKAAIGFALTATNIGNSLVISGAGIADANSSINIAGRALTFSAGSTGRLELGGTVTSLGTFTHNDCGTVSYDDSSDQTVANVNYWNLEVATASSAKASIGFALTPDNIGNSLIVAGAGIADVNADIDLEGRTLTFAASSTGRIDLGSTVTSLGTLVHNNAGTVRYDGAADQVVLEMDYYKLDIATTGGAKALIDYDLTPTNIASSLIVTGTGVADIDGDVNLAGRACTFASGSTGRMEVSGTVTSLGTFTPRTGTMRYDGAADQTVANVNYYHLEAAGTGGAKTLIGFALTPTNVAGSLIVTGAAVADVDASVDLTGSALTFTAGGTGRLELGGSVASLGTITSNSCGTVVFNSAGAQNLPAGTYWNVTLDKAAGTATATGTVAVGGALALTAGALDINTRTVTVTGAISGTGPVTISTGVLTSNGSIDLTGGSLTFTGAGTLNLAGTAAGLGTFTPATGTVVYKNTAADTTALAVSYYNLTVQTSTRTVTAAGGLAVAGALTLTSGKFDAGGSTVTVAGGASGSGTLQIGAGTVDIEGTVDISATTFTGAGTLRMAGTVTSLGTFTASTGTVVYDGAGAQTVAAVAYCNLTIAKPGATATVSSTCSASGTLQITGGTLSVTSGTLTASGTLSGSGTLGIGAGTVTVSGNLNMAGGTVSFSGSGTLNLSGTVTSVGSFSAGTGTVVYKNTGADQSVLALTYNNLTIQNSTRTATAAGGFTVNGALTLTSGTFDVGGATVTVAGTVSGSGALRIGSGTLDANGTYNVTGDTTFTGSGTLRLGSTVTSLGTFTASTGTVVYDSGADQSVAAVTYWNLSVSKSAGVATAAGNFAVGGALTIPAGTFSAGTRTVTANGSISGSGTMAIGSGTITANGGIDLTGGATTFTGTGNLNLVGAVTSLGTFTAGSGTVTYKSTTADQSVMALAYYNLAVNNAPRTATASSDLSVAGALTLTSGTLDIAGRTATVAGTTSGSGALRIGTGTYDANGTVDLTGGSVTFTGAGRLELGGDVTSLGTLDAGGAGRVVFNSGGAQGVPAAAYHHLEVNKSAGTATASAGFTVGGDLYATAGTFSAGTRAVIVNGDISGSGAVAIGSGSITANGGIDLAGGSTTFTSTGNLNLVGPVTSLGTFTAGAGTVTYKNTSAGQTVLALAYNNLAVNNGTMTATAASDLSVAGTLTLTSGTLDLNSRTATVTGATSGAGTLRISTGVLDANGSFDLTGGALTFTGAGTLRLGDTVTSLGTFTPSTGTVVYDGGSAQTVRAAAYHHLTVAKPAGVGATAGAGFTTTGNLTLTSGSFSVGSYTVAIGGNVSGAGTLTIPTGTLTANGGFDLTGGATTFSSTGNLNLAGTVTSLGTFTAGSGTVTYKNTGADQSVLVLAYNNLAINNSPRTATAAGDLTVGGALTVTSGTFAAATRTVTVTGATSGTGKITIGTGKVDANGSFDLTGGSIDFLGAGRLELGGTVTSLGTLTSNGMGRVVFNSGGTQSVPAGAYHHLEINKSAGTATASGDSTASGDLALAAGTFALSSRTLTVTGSVSGSGTLTISTGTLNAQGSFDLTGGTLTFTGSGVLNLRGAAVSLGTFTAGSGTVNYLNTAAGQSVFAVTYNNLGVNNAPQTATAAGSFAVGGALVVSGGTFALGANTVTVTGATSGAGTITISTGVLDANGSFDLTGGALTFTGAGTLRLASTVTSLGTFTPATGTVVYDGTAAQALIGTAYHHLTVAKPSGVAATAGGNFQVGGNLTISGGTLAVGTRTASATGATSGAGTLSISSGSFTASGAYDLTGGATTFSGSGTLNLDGAVTSLGAFTASTGTVNYRNTGADQSVFAVTYCNLGVNNAPRTATAAGTFSVGGTLTVTSGTFAVGANTVTATGAVSGAGTISISSGVLDSNGGYDLTGGATTFTGAGTLRLAGAANVLGTFTPATGTVVYDGAGAQSVAAVGYHHLTVDKSGVVTATAAGDFTVGGNLTVSGGVLAVGARTVAVTGATSGAGTLTISTGTVTASGAFGMSGGAVTFTGAGTLNLDGAVTSLGTFTASTGTVNYRNTGADQTVPAVTYWNLGVANAPRTATAGGNFAVGGALTVSSGTFDVATRTVTVAGAISGAGTVGIGSGTLDANGGYDLAGGATTFTGDGRLELGGAVGSLGTFTASTGTVLYNGSADQAAAGVNYYKLEVATSGGARATFGSALSPTSVGHSLTITGAGIADVDAAFDLTGRALTFTASGTGRLELAGAVTSLGTFTSNNCGTVKFDGAVDQTVPAAAYHMLAVDNFPHVATAGGDFTVGSTLTLTAGALDIAGRTATITGTTSGAGTLRIGAGAFTASGTYNLTGGATTFTGSGSLTLAGALTSLGTFTAATGRVVYANTAAGQTVANVAYYDLEVANGGQTAAISHALTPSNVGGTLTITGLSVVTAAADVDLAGRALVFTGAGALRLGAGAPSLGTFTAATGTVTFQGGGARTLGGTAPAFYKLTVTSNTALTADTDASATNLCTLDAGSSIVVGPGRTLTLALGLTTGGTLQLGAGSTLRTGGNLSVTAGGTFRAAGAEGNVAAVRNNGSGTYTFSMAGATDVTWADFHNLAAGGVTLSGAGTTVFDHVNFQSGAPGLCYLHVTNSAWNNHLFDYVSFRDPGGSAKTIEINTQVGDQVLMRNYTQDSGWIFGDSTDIETAGIVIWMNRQPEAQDDSVVVQRDSGANTLDVLANDTDPDLDVLTITAVTQGAHGAVAIVSAGTRVTYTPAAGYVGPDSFTYTVDDGHAGTDTATVTVLVNDRPDAIDDSFIVQIDSGANPLDVLANDTDPNNDVLTVTVVTQGAHGTVAIIESGAKVSYAPAAGYFGADSFAYTVSDGHGRTDTAIVTIAVNRPPVAVDDSATVQQDSSAVTIDVLANDSDPDGDTLTITAVTQGAHGEVAITDGGTRVSYTPEPGYAGPDSFTYTVSDGRGGTDTATVTISVNGPPDAVEDSVTVQMDSGANTLHVLANDTDPEADALTITGVTQGTHGTVAIILAGTRVTYTPAGGYWGPDSFTYTVSDGRGGIDTATVTVKVNAPPTIDDFSPATPATVSVGATQDFTVTVSDANGDTPIYAWTIDGQTVPDTDNTLSYTPGAADLGARAIRVTVTDGSGGQVVQNWAVTVGLAKPTLVGPSGQLNNSWPTFTWNAVSGATSYQLVMGDWHTLYNVTQAGTSWRPPATLEAGTVYWWQVRAINGAFTSEFTNGGFIGGTTLPTPVPIGPSGVVNSLQPTFSWQASAGATSYDLWIVDQNGFRVSSVATAATSVKAPQPLTPGTQYGWQVRAISATEKGFFSAVTSFTVTPAVATPVQIGPSGDVSTLQPTFSWNAVAGATGYEAYAYTVGGTRVVALSTTATSVKSNVFLLDGQEYKWQVRAKTAAEYGMWSGFMNFTARAPVAVPAPIGPSGAVNSLMPTFSWGAVGGATGYEAYVYTSAGTRVMILSTTGTSIRANTTLTDGQAYKWQVRAKAGTEYGAWSAFVNFAPTSPLATPVQIGPSGTVTGLKPTFGWGAVAGATGYDVWVYTASGTRVLVLGATGTSVTAPSNLVSGQAYKWQVRAYAGTEPGAWSAQMNFTPQQ